jgi:hypothetical protein
MVDESFVRVREHGFSAHDAQLHSFRILKFIRVARSRGVLLSHATMNHFFEIQLTFQEARVLGCLLEKKSSLPAASRSP